MDVIKMEPAVDSLALQVHDRTSEMEENDPLSEVTEKSCCETWTLTLREEHRLRVFENKVFRKIFGAKRDAVIGEWRKLHNTELHALYSSPDIIRNIKSRYLKWAGHVARMGEFGKAYSVGWEAGGKKTFGGGPDEGNLSHLDVTDMKTECVDQSYDIKSEIKVEDPKLEPISFAMMKTEVDDDFLDVDRLQQEQKVKVSSEGDEVLTERFVNHAEKSLVRERMGSDSEENKLTQCDSNRPDCSDVRDLGLAKMEYITGHSTNVADCSSSWQYDLLQLVGSPTRIAGLPIHANEMILNVKNVATGGRLG
ncbi:hypothetical protein ANN_27478 [Periplaneta americana]|uniref:Uncharacterized protein n=1 Tax=Periplaneta americana TaxID=6978 RepID=A0ABQ8RW47_PERAM|nr:hypothetical protein ANN_27478 [Periplaneta americana]